MLGVIQPARLLVRAEFALAAAEAEVLGALDREQRYSLLQSATTESPAICTAAQPGLV
jgi:hypothetical protein